jgi:hypothetical protein
MNQMYAVVRMDIIAIHVSRLEATEPVNTHAIELSYYKYPKLFCSRQNENYILKVVIVPGMMEYLKKDVPVHMETIN